MNQKKIIKGCEVFNKIDKFLEFCVDLFFRSVARKHGFKINTLITQCKSLKPEECGLSPVTAKVNFCIAKKTSLEFLGFSECRLIPNSVECLVYKQADMHL